MFDCVVTVEDLECAVNDLRRGQDSILNHGQQQQQQEPPWRRRAQEEEGEDEDAVPVHLDATNGEKEADTLPTSVVF